MHNNISLETHSTFDYELIEEIENFILQSDSKFNPLFSSPLWAQRLKEKIGFNYRMRIIRKENIIIAVHLMFSGYRGYAKIKKLPIFLQLLFKIFVSRFFSYVNWNNPICLKKNLDEEISDKVYKMIYQDISLEHVRIEKSPIDEAVIELLHDRYIGQWGTFVMEFSGKTYEEVFAGFRRQARRSIEKTLNTGVEVRRLQREEIPQYVHWLKEVQGTTGKSYHITENDILSDYILFGKKNYIYEIFVAYLDKKMLGSMGIWGFGHFITEWGVFQSEYATENKLYVQDVIKNAVVKYAYTRGIQRYDLAGYNPSSNASSKEIAIKQFKEKFRGTEIVYSTVNG